MKFDTGAKGGEIDGEIVMERAGAGLGEDTVFVAEGPGIFSLEPVVVDVGVEVGEIGVEVADLIVVADFAALNGDVGDGQVEDVGIRGAFFRRHGDVGVAVAIDPDADGGLDRKSVV